MNCGFSTAASLPERRDKVLMLDARNVFRKVTRKIYDFSPEQMKNLSAIVWLYRGQQDRFLALVKDYLGAVCAESAAVPEKLAVFETTLTRPAQTLRIRLPKAVAKHDRHSTQTRNRRWRTRAPN